MDGIDRVDIQYYDKVLSKKVDWLWYPYIPYGKVTVIQGDPGEGKSTLMLQIASLLTNGMAMPDGSGGGKKCTVIYQGAEDGISDTIKPRLEQAGADCSRIAFLRGNEDESLLLDVQKIQFAIEETGASLLVLDPLQAFLGADSDMQKVNGMRTVFSRFSSMAEETGCAVVLIGHMNKSSGSKGIYRGLGSIDIAAAARSILLVGRDREQPTLRYLVPIKSSLAPEGNAFAFELHPEHGFRWIGASDCTAEEILSGSVKREDSKKERAKDVLCALLDGTDLLSNDVFRKLSEIGIGKRTVEQAKREMPIEAYKKRDKWYWHLER